MEVIMGVYLPHDVMSPLTHNQSSLECFYENTIWPILKIPLICNCRQSGTELLLGCGKLRNLWETIFFFTTKNDAQRAFISLQDFIKRRFVQNLLTCVIKAPKLKAWWRAIKLCFRSSLFFLVVWYWRLRALEHVLCSRAESSVGMAFLSDAH